MNISKELKSIGACFAGNSDKYICAQHNCCQPLDGDKPAYHIHPDASEPRQDSIKRFESLRELESWINMCKRAAKAESQEAAHEIYMDWHASH